MRLGAMVVALACVGSLRAEDAPAYPNKANLLVVRDAKGERPVHTVADWELRRAHVMAHFQTVAGPMPTGPKVALDVRVVDELVTEKYVRKNLAYAAGPGNRVPAFLFVPRNLGGKKAPGVLVPHPTNREHGKGVPAGLAGKPDRHQAVHLAERGYVVLAPDYVHSGGYRFDPYENGFVSATMLGIWNHRIGLDLLQSLPEVDGDALGVIGHSLGGHNSMFVALFDPRVKAIVSNCGFCSFPTYMKGNIAGWSHAGYMPRLKEIYKLDLAKTPFDFPEIVGALAPRAFLASAPVRDHNFDVGGVKDCLRAATPIYRLYGAEEKLIGNYPDAGHDFPDDARDVAYAWLDRWLKPNARK